MKSIVLMVVIVLSITKAFTQNILDEKQFKLDTIEADFIAEYNSSFNVYSISDGIFQDNMIYLDSRNNGKFEFKDIYNTDTIFTLFEKNTKTVQTKIIEQANKLNLNQFYNQLHHYQKSSSEVKNNVQLLDMNSQLQYLLFHAKIVFLDVGESVIYIPSIYNILCNDKLVVKNKYSCPKYFKKNFKILDVLEFHYQIIESKKLFIGSSFIN